MKYLKQFEGFKEFISRFYKKDEVPVAPETPIRQVVTPISHFNPLKELEKYTDGLKAFREFKNKVDSDIPDILQILRDEELDVNYTILKNKLGHPERSLVVWIDGIFSQPESPADSKGYRERLRLRRSEYGELVSEVIERIEDSFNVSISNQSSDFRSRFNSEIERLSVWPCPKIKVSSIYVDRLGDVFSYNFCDKVVCRDITLGTFQFQPENDQNYINFDNRYAQMVYLLFTP